MQKTLSIYIEMVYNQKDCVYLKALYLFYIETIGYSDKKKGW